MNKLFLILLAICMPLLACATSDPVKNDPVAQVAPNPEQQPELKPEPQPQPGPEPLVMKDILVLKSGAPEGVKVLVKEFRENDLIYCGPDAPDKPVTLPYDEMVSINGLETGLVQKSVKDMFGLEPSVEKLRGLKFKSAVPKKIVSKAEWDGMLEKSINDELPPEKAIAMSKALAKFGLLPEGYDLAAGLKKLYSDQAAAFYSSDDNYLALLTTWSDNDVLAAQTFGMVKTISVYISHELCHALDDQNFNLNDFKKKYYTNDDSGLAAMSVIEGAATLVMFDYVIDTVINKLPFVTEESKPAAIANMRAQIESSIQSGQLDDMMMSSSDPQAKALVDTPKFLRDSLIFPYMTGFIMVNRAQRELGPRAIDLLYANPPLSTENVLHPERMREDPPIGIALPDGSVDPGRKAMYANVMGEFGVRHILETFFKEKNIVDTAATGWGGDFFSATSDSADGEAGVVWLTAWDTELDAKEFSSTYRILLSKKYSGDASFKPTAVSAASFLAGTSKGEVYVERRGKEVLVLESMPIGSSAKTSAAVWNSKK